LNLTKIIAVSQKSFTKDGIKMSPKTFMRSTIMAVGILGAALAGGWPTPGMTEQSYPWCTQGSLLHCYYMTREQCEQTVDYHGFCVHNPGVSPREQ
jgi:hypothetical protein